MTTRLFQIYRYDPDRHDRPYMQNFDIALDGSERMLLDALMVLKARDPTLSFRRSCREGFSNPCRGCPSSATCSST